MKKDSRTKKGSGERARKVGGIWVDPTCYPFRKNNY